MMKWLVVLVATVYSLCPAFSQSDTLRIYDLPPIDFRGIKDKEVVTPLPNVYKTFIIGGRKSEVLDVDSLAGNITEKTGRQIFAKIPSGFVYDMDGSGNQVNFSVRGLDAHRSWEFNVRQNGTIINTDLYGYPASHYSMPMEAVERIELLRGTAALQYGQQFGGMVNYILKKPDTTKQFSYENMTTAGSFGLFSSYNAIGGKVGKLTYHAYYHKRLSEGYRQIARSDADAQYMGLTYDFSENLSLEASLSRSRYLYRIPGPLTDEQFMENPRQATRRRNFFAPEIYIPSIHLGWKISPNTMLEWVASGVFGNRSSVTFDAFADVPDIIQPDTHEFAPRNVDIDNYHSRTAEARMLHEYRWRKTKNYLTASLRYFNNKFDRRQRGLGTMGSDFDLTVMRDFTRNIVLHSESLAFALENQFNLAKKLSFSPGIRYEYGQSAMSGRIDYLEAESVPRIIPYRFFTLGAHAAYFINSSSKIYGGISQAIRPVLFQDLIPGNPLAAVSSDLEHSFGYNAELGWENVIGDRLKYNATLFSTYIGKRIGNILINEDGQTLIARSNVGNSRTDGVELYLDWKVWNHGQSSMSFFTSSSYMDSRYLDGTVSNGENNVDISGNVVESVPKWISRNGVTYVFNAMKFILQHQFVSETFADAVNTIRPLESGAVGLVPSYHIWDLNMAFPFLQRFLFRAGINNIFDKQYFTKRPQMYPGPGIWPSDGRGFNVSLNVKI
ncbi:TonB-dependent receptor family protein [Negadavirga shengliensis]|uniref:TonB-dependent receptor family protein n=1 Tax=Negadavirga shengliensis TaxID=1389218 RepID=A0ABV9T2G3_9BACT